LVTVLDMEDPVQNEQIWLLHMIIDLPHVLREETLAFYKTRR
jgi:hypothetical protein